MIVGRGEQLAALETALVGAGDGYAQRVLLVGDVGMGKSMLLDLAARHADARGFAVARARCPPRGDEPWLLLTSVLGEVGGSPARPPPPGWRVTQAAERLAQVVITRTAQTPLLLTVDDLHWADAASLATLSLASAGWENHRVAVVGTWRGQRPDRRLSHWTPVLLPPLTVRDAVTLLRQSGITVSRARAEQLAAALGCCPLALVEYERVQRGSPAVSRNPGDIPPLHEHLREAWCSAVEALPERARRALRVVCVLATPHLELLTAVLAAEGLTLDDLDSPTQRGLLTWPAGPGGAGPAPATQGPLLVSAVRSTAAPSVQRRLHGHAAAAAQASGLPPAVVVHHLELAALPGDEHRADALAEQAERAHADDQPGVAVSGWQAAARLTSDPESRRRRAVAAARTWLLESTSREQGPELTALLDSVELQGPAQLWREWARAEVLADRDLAASAHALARAAEHATTTMPSLTAHLLWGSVVTSWMAGHPQAALRTARLLDEWLRAGRDGVPPWAGAALLGTALLQAGDVGQGAPLVVQAREAAGRHDFPAPMSLSALVDAVSLDDVLLLSGEAADQRLDDLARRLADDDAASLAGATLARAWRARRRGDWEAARREVERGQALARSVRAVAQEHSALALVVELDALTGSPDLADHLAELRERCARVGDRLGHAHACRAAALAALAAGRPGEAVPELEHAVAVECLGRGLADAPLAARVDLVEALVATHRRAEAQALATVLDPLLAEHPDPAAVAARHRCRGLLADDDAAEHFAAALAVPGLDPFEQARTQLLSGEQRRRARHPVAARVDLQAAATQFALLGAAPWHARACAELRAAGAAASPPPPGAPSLTQQEQRVAAVIARGSSTRDAATALGLSPRTVESHLAHAYRKLGVVTRAGLAQALSAAQAGG